MREGGALLFNDVKYRDRAEILREKGTDRSKFFRGQVDKYTWVDFGSSYLPSDLNAAYLYAQLELAKEINDKRMAIFDAYMQGLESLEEKGVIERPFIPDYAVHNAHMFYMKVKDLATRSELIEYLKTQGVLSVFHYIPLHSAKAGKKFGRFHGEDIYTTKESERLLRLPMFYNLEMEDVQKVIEAVLSFPGYKSIHD